MTTTRKYTNQLLELVDEGIIPARTALLSALCYMSESDVEDMMRNDEYLVEEEEEEEMENFNYVGSRHHY